MIWDITDDGTLSVRLSAEGERVVQVARAKGQRFIEQVDVDMTSMGIDVTTDELRFRTYKLKDRMDVIWRATIAPEHVPAARDYMITLALSEAGE